MIYKDCSRSELHIVRFNAVQYASEYALQPYTKAEKTEDSRLSVIFTIRGFVIY